MRRIVCATVIVAMLVACGASAAPPAQQQQQTAPTMAPATPAAGSTAAPTGGDGYDYDYGN